MFTEEDYRVINKEFESLKKYSLKRCANQEEFELVLKAFDFANEAHKGVRRRSGEPYILHPIAVAKIVVQEIGLGSKSICAALLHDVVEDTNYTVEDIKNHFGQKIASLVDGLTKIKTALDSDNISYSRYGPVPNDPLTSRRCPYSTHQTGRPSYYVYYSSYQIRKISAD